ncbi:class I adenylate-forming enzyme family protein [Tomitella fengzijianii]|uniref:AMP-binding protein n=1 Tax=Tomitella fengzijianii TaxID=2597660 RepID=A0A516X834_9ACTN|nr:AMP-binding protein [Tomitella fengzijianii]QDQ98801.1 AMP-binding protein [Tomitella fengzijianii]
MTDFTGLPETFWGLLAHRAALTPDATMLVDEKGRSETFAAVLHEAERVAAGLLEIGVREGDTVSWQLPTRIETVVLSFALARIGATQNPIIPVYRSREVAAMVRQCDARWFITVEEFRGFAHGALARELAHSSGIEALVLGGTMPQGDPGALPPPPRSGSDIRWIYTTSGTTSEPKGVCHSDSSLIAGGLGLADATKLVSSDVTTIFYPYAHIGGPDMMVAVLAVGMHTVLMEIFEPAAAMALQRAAGVTMSGGGTPFYLLYMEQQLAHGSEPLVPTLKSLSGGGSPMPEWVYHDVRDAMGIQVLHGYGMTECPMIAQGGPDDDPERLATTAGRPVLGCEVEIRGDDGEPLGRGEAGKVLVRGSMLFHHYLVDGEIDVPHDADGWFPTGDVGYLTPDGHVVLVGREKDLIIRKGESISPMEIEDVLKGHPSIADTAVIGMPDPVRGERICAVIELIADSEPPTIDDLRTLCLEAGLAPFKAPEQVEVVRSMPRTPTMKIRKQELRQHLQPAGTDDSGRFHAAVSTG